jgi:hypothetical protein
MKLASVESFDMKYIIVCRGKSWVAKLKQESYQQHLDVLRQMTRIDFEVYSAHLEHRGPEAIFHR